MEATAHVIYGVVVKLLDKQFEWKAGAYETDESRGHPRWLFVLLSALTRELLTLV